MDNFQQAVEILRVKLLEPLPGPQAHMRLAPKRSDVQDRHVVTGRNCREAAVLVPLLPAQGIPHVLMTVRRDHLAQHAGQVSFPGGRREEGEAFIETALRETHEEVGLEPAEVEILGALSPLYIPPSNYCVYPFVGITKNDPSLTPHDFEVERIIRVPLSSIAEASALKREYRMIRGERVLVPYFFVADLEIWGATAMMLSELISLFD